MKKYEKEKEKYLEWLKADTEARHYIASTIPDSLLVKTINHKTSTDLWNAICLEHEGKTHVFRMEMIRQIHNERCTDSDDVHTHLANMVCLREELAATGETLDDKTFTSILTNSLPESYGHVVSTACTTATIMGQSPTIEQIITIVQSEYSRRQIEGLAA